MLQLGEEFQDLPDQGLCSRMSSFHKQPVSVRGGPQQSPTADSIDAAPPPPQPCKKQLGTGVLTEMPVSLFKMTCSRCGGRMGGALNLSSGLEM